MRTGPSNNENNRRHGTIRSKAQIRQTETNHKTDGRSFPYILGSGVSALQRKNAQRYQGTSTSFKCLT